jgi:hypothetical protein
VATSVQVILWDWGHDYFTVKFQVNATWAANYKVVYGLKETGEERVTGNFYVGANGSYTTQTATFTGLKPDTRYTAYATLWNADTNTDLSEQPGGDECYHEDWTYTDSKPVSVRPDDWEWEGTITKGAALEYTKISDTEYEVYPMTAAEWNDFVERVFEFIEYKPLSYQVGSASNFYVKKGAVMLADDVNYVRRLIKDLDPPIAPPSAVSSGGKITAAFFIGLKNSLNSIE